MATLIKRAHTALRPPLPAPSPPPPTPTPASHPHPTHQNALVVGAFLGAGVEDGGCRVCLHGRVVGVLAGPPASPACASTGVHLRAFVPAILRGDVERVLPGGNAAVCRTPSLVSAAAVAPCIGARVAVTSRASHPPVPGVVAGPFGRGGKFRIELEVPLPLIRLGEGPRTAHVFLRTWVYGGPAGALTSYVPGWRAGLGRGRRWEAGA